MDAKSRTCDPLCGQRAGMPGSGHSETSHPGWEAGGFCFWVRERQIGCLVHLRPQARHRYQRGPVVGHKAQSFLVFPHRFPPTAFALINAA